jgi:hypothetical protein
MFYFLMLKFENHTLKILTLGVNPKLETLKFQFLHYKAKPYKPQT